MPSYSEQHLSEAKRIIELIDSDKIEKMVELLADLRRREGRLFFLGSGGGAGHASHAVNDFRKIAGIESYTPIDNVSELTARVNDDGWETTFINWLKGSHLGHNDMLFIFSVGGGSLEHNISPNLVLALDYARGLGAEIVGIVGRDGGYTSKVADACLIVPTVNNERVTPHTESFQALIWHLLVSHPLLQEKKAKWESSVS
ncbi:Phosphoheptose isomerase 1 [subsurface metagenome]